MMRIGEEEKKEDSMGRKTQSDDMCMTHVKMSSAERRDKWEKTTHIHIGQSID